MPDDSPKAAPETLKQSVRHTVEQMSVSEIIALIEFAEHTRDEKQKTAQEELLSEFRERAAALGLSLETLVAPPTRRSATAPAKASATKLPPKYRSPSGEEWTGRGRTPKWLATLEAEGRKREDFAA